jgi:NTP pyrophosphatase (non-canonical NTP hydrolase)
MSRDEIFDEIDDERDRQDQKFGRQMHDDAVWLAIVSEEVGEAAQEVLTQRFGSVGKGHGDLREELLQVASVTIAWIEWLDQKNKA